MIIAYLKNKKDVTSKQVLQGRDKLSDPESPLSDKIKICSGISNKIHS